MSNKSLEQIKVIKERMITAGIPEPEVDALVGPLKEELQRRVCGLVWEHTTTSIPDMEGKVPALMPVTDKNIVSDIKGDNHILIEGENLLALMAMQYTHINENGKGMIDVIYIDPPYNTGSVSFAYNDKFEKSEWLSMMDIRLKLARNLLKDDGVMFISIDDSYQAVLKILCDDIFGADKFVANIINQSANSVFGMKATHKGKTFVKTKDYVLVYRKSEELSLMPLYTPSRSLLHDSHDFVIENDVKMSTTEWFKKKYDGFFASYGLTINKQNIQKLMLFDNTFKADVYEQLLDKQFRTVGSYNDKHLSKEEIELLESGHIVKHGDVLLYRESGGAGLTTTLRSLRESCQIINGELIKCDILGDVWNTSSGYQNVNAEGGVRFPNGKKPLILLKKILASLNKPNAVVLDFFAGSGTTGHAVLDLNKEDNGHRQFILCTNNELGKEALKTSKKNGYMPGSDEYESLGVCRAVTYKRMKNIFPDYPGNNLYYYRIDQNVAESAIDDVTVANMASQAVFYVAMKENVFNAEQHDDYYLLYDDKTEITVVTDPDMDMFDVEDEIVPTAFTKEHRKVYCSVYEPCTKAGIDYIPYPKEVLDVLKAVKKYIRREVA